jgi:acylphosphatase
MEDRPTRRYVASGRVQGVGFRYFVQRKAVEIGLVGWVRNRPDGTVEAEAAGDPAQLEAFELALRAGPPLARVDHLAVSPAPSSGETSFRITG